MQRADVADSFGAPSWSEDEQVVAFSVAEPADDEGGKQPAARFEYLPAFGETMPDRRRSAIYLARYASDALVKVIDSTIDHALAFGQPAIISATDARVELFATAYSTLKDGSRLGFVCACAECERARVIEQTAPTARPQSIASASTCLHRCRPTKTRRRSRNGRRRWSSARRSFA